MRKMSFIIFVVMLAGLLISCQEPGPAVSGSGQLCEILVKSIDIDFINVLPEGVELSVDIVPVEMTSLGFIVSSGEANSTLEINVPEGEIEWMEFNHQDFDFDFIYSDGKRIELVFASKSGKPVQGEVINLLLNGHDRNDVSMIPVVAVERENVELWRAEVSIDTNIPISSVVFETTLPEDDLVRMIGGEFFPVTFIEESDGRVQVNSIEIPSEMLAGIFLAPASQQALLAKYSEFFPIVDWEKGCVYAFDSSTFWTISLPVQGFTEQPKRITTWGGMKQ